MAGDSFRIEPVAVFHGEVPLEFTLFSNNLMKRTLLLLTLLIFAFASVQATAQTVKRPFNGTDLTGWKTNGDWENCWKAGFLRADATTFEIFQPPANQNQPRPANQNQARSGMFAPSLANVIDVNWMQMNPRKGVDIYTEEKFGDCTVKLEFLITKGSNSGVYLMGEYEVQVADSFAKPNNRLGQGDMGAIYSATAPSLNACGVPGTWQSYEIEFVAPKFDASGNKTANAVFKKVILNGVVVQENVEVKGSTGGGVTGKEAATGPLMLQGNHGPVAYRNIEIIVP